MSREAKQMLWLWQGLLILALAGCVSPRDHVEGGFGWGYLEPAAEFESAQGKSGWGQDLLEGSGLQLSSVKRLYCGGWGV